MMRFACDEDWTDLAEQTEEITPRRLAELQESERIKNLETVVRAIRLFPETKPPKRQKQTNKAARRKGKKMSETEIVAVDAQHTAEERGLAMYHEAEERAKLMNVLVPSLLKATHSGDIIDQGGKPFIADSGCEKIARVAGVSFGRPEVESGFAEDDTGKRYFSVTIRGEASILGQTIFEVGGCDEFDKFIASRRLPFGQRKLEVEKKAYCNWRGRCVRTLLGMTGLRWEDLEKHGITRDGRTKIEYKEGSKSHADGGKAEAVSAESEDVRQKIREQILKNLDNNEEDAKQALMRLTSFTDKDGKEVKGRESVSQLSEKWAFALWGKIKPGGKERDNYESIIMEIVAARKEKAGAK